MTDSPAFSPVPVTTRHDGWTPERQRAFVEQLARCGVVSAAARAVGMSPKSAYALRKRAGAESFAAAWEEAACAGLAASLDLSIDRAVEGVLQPVIRRGRQVGERRQYNDRLLMAALRTLGERASGAGAPLSLEDALRAIEP